ncbi:MAG: polysaccharide biosynthesis protein [Desulfobacterium sp.]|nr:polysaccharide biosynthesis protein [Desulfobacterium sp.]
MKIKIRKNLLFLIALDSLLLVLSYLLSYMIRFEGSLTALELTTIKNTIVPLLLCKLIVFYHFNLYSGMWRYTSIVDLMNVIKSVSVSSLFIVSFIVMYSGFYGFSRSVFIIDGILSLIFISGIRLSIRMILSSSQTAIGNESPVQQRKMIIIGAGDAGEKVMREIKDNPNLQYQVVGFIDDDKGKVGKHIHGVRIFGRVDQLEEIVKRESVDELLIATPSTDGENMRRIVKACEATNLPYKTLPGMGELIDGRVSIKTIRDISYKDLLGRPSVYLENDKILDMLKDKCVLVTGAGGSIGSSLCRQICKYKPSLIILFDASESNLYSIQMELKHLITYLKYRAVLGRVQDVPLLNSIFTKYKPDVVFHAAAYKHVPLVERNPWEAVYSNIIGTDSIIKVSIAHKVERFILISSDKAVRPTNVMGASKRIAEKMLQAESSNDTRLMAVRFGNVIGSSGSVIPLFLKQIENGGPVTITHPEITRYFMTMEEAAQLILQAFTMGHNGEIFILEMGVPIKIVDMAKDLIRLSGKKPEDIEVKFTGLRPGEKLYEELITEGEGIKKTKHEKILVLKNGLDYPDENQKKQFEDKIAELVELAKKHDAKRLKEKLKEIVPEYTISDDEAVI